MCLPTFFFTPRPTRRPSEKPIRGLCSTFETEHDFRHSSKREASDLQLLKFHYSQDGCTDFRNFIDTIVTFDPETYQETIQIGKSEYTAAKLKQVLLAQEWYYDHCRNLVAVKLKAIAPIVDVFDENNALMYTRKQYYLHF